MTDHPMNQCIDSSAIKARVRSALESGESSESCEILRNRSGGRGMLMRLAGPDNESWIVKAWQSRDLKEHFKRMLGLSMARREWRAHRHVERAGLSVPHPVLYFQTRCSDGRWFEVVVVEDLGPTTNGLVHLKALLHDNDEDAVRRFEDRVIEMTGRLIDARIIDVDHQLRNIVINGSNQPTRIDFECAQPQRWRGIANERYGQMIAQMVCSHIYACQPDVERSEAFAHRMVHALNPPPDVLAIARHRIDRNLEHQRRTQGVDSQLNLAW